MSDITAQTFLNTPVNYSAGGSLPLDWSTGATSGASTQLSSAPAVQGATTTAPAVQGVTNTAPPPTPQQSTGTDYQALWQAAGHAGQAPVGYHGESSGGGGQTDPLAAGTASYISQLNDILNNGLPTEAAGQNQTAQSSYDLGASTAATNKSSAETTVNTATAKNLKDLGSNMQNLFQGGNVYLGARGAGDSSAANQYAFALTQMGSKQRASILSDATTRLGQIGDIYNNQMATLKSGLDTQLGNIASWLANAQNTIKSQIGSIGYQSAQQQSQQAYNLAMNAANNANASLTSNRQALQTWAENNSTSTQSLIKNLQAVEQTPQWGGLNGTPTVSGGNTSTPSLFGAAGGKTITGYDSQGNPIYG